MYQKNDKKTYAFFSSTGASQTDFNQGLNTLRPITDINRFKTLSMAIVERLQDPETTELWKKFCDHIKQFSQNASEKLLIMRLAFRCLQNPVESGELSQLLALMRHLKSVYGQMILHLFSKAEPSLHDCSISAYIQISQLLLDLHEDKSIIPLLNTSLPNIPKVLETLREKHEEYLNKKYPTRDLDTVIKSFTEKKSLLQFPLSVEEVAGMKANYLTIKTGISALKSMSQTELAARLKSEASLWRKEKAPSALCQMLSILAETIRRQYSILPYDTQILAVLALIHCPDSLKGRIGQIRTGEGKSTVIAMLNAFMAAQGHFVDMITSSSYLGIRDCKKYLPFYQALGFSASDICDIDPEPRQFDAQILYGTNTDFEFALLRDGLYNRNLRFSSTIEGKRVQRTPDVAIIDEVDNLFLDTALNAAQLAVPDYSDISWLFPPILEFAKTKPGTEGLVEQLRAYIQNGTSRDITSLLSALSDKHLLRWYRSAHRALFVCEENKDYIIKTQAPRFPGDTRNHKDITIVDYSNTGRTMEGSQWQHGVHQFLQLKHQLQMTPLSKTGASISHPAYFNLYQHTIGVTGTMGELSERDEIQRIYKVSSFDVPPTFPSLRQRKSDFLLQNKQEKWSAILKNIKTLRDDHRPSLVLFKTIEESAAFSIFLHKQGVQHQLLNETQQESEDYLIAQAGEAGAITIATNTAGRGTDILLSPESREAGGLELIFTFYPDNLRVEEQGLGRAGRQGQPGAAYMILSIDDEHVSQLISSNPLLLAQTLQHLSTQKQDLQPADDLMKALHELRSTKVEWASQQRLQASEQEIQYFAKLQDFFHSMAKVTAILDTDASTTQLIQICRKHSLEEASLQAFESNDPHWDGLQDMAHSLVEQQHHGLQVNWNNFIMRYKELYLNHIRDAWATYYSKLRDDLEKNTQESAWQYLSPLLQAPMEQAERILSQLLSMAGAALLSQKAFYSN